MKNQLAQFDAAIAKVFGSDWKTTFQAYLTLFSICGGSALTYLAQVQNPKPWELWLTGALTSTVGIAKLIVGHMQQDAGSVNVSISGGPSEVVPSTEVPLVANATVIPKEK